MIPIKQTVLHDPANGKIGNCLSAVLASILHIPIEDVPNFQDPHNWLRDLNKWLRPHGLGYINYEDYDLWTNHQELTGSYHLISGNTNRSVDVSHACVGLDSYIVFDPHPSDDGLINKNCYGVFVALRPWEVAQLNSMTVEKANNILSEENNISIDKFGGVDHVTLDGKFTKEQLKAMVFLMEENEKSKPTSRNVTKEEHDLMMAATLRSSIVIAKGRLVDPKSTIQTFPKSQDSKTML